MRSYNGAKKRSAGYGSREQAGRKAENSVNEALDERPVEYSPLLTTDDSWAVVAEQAEHKGELYWSS